MPKKKQVFEPENLESIRSAISGLIVEPPETIEPVVYSVDLLSRHDPYYPMVQGEATSRLAMTATRNMAINPITGDAVIEDEGFRAFFEGYDGLKIGLTVGAQKLLSTAALYLTQNNHYRPEESARIETEVQIPLISYARLLGYPVDERETATPEEAEKEKRRIKNLMKDVRGKINDCAQCGIESRSINLPADTTQDTLLAEVKKLADDSAVHGILVQLPLPAQIDEKAVIDAIPPEKDVDGFSPVNVGRMQIGEPCYLPCTPAGCIRMIESTGTDIAGKNAVVIGRSNIVGKPAALLLLAKNATVTICHSRTKNLKEVCAAADILVAAVGREGFVTGDMVKPGAVVIDVGINRGADGKLHGDVNFAEAAEKAAYITPVPGGVGPMTRAMLMLNTVEAAERQSR